MPSTGPADRNVSGNNWSNWVLQAFFGLSATTTYTPGTGGGSAKTVTPPFRLALMTVVGSDTANGTEATAINCPGYLTLAAGAQTIGFTVTTSVANSNSAQSYTATASWSTIAGIEIWDSAATKLRYLQSAYSGSTFSSITGIASGDTVQFPSTAISYDGTGW